MNTPDVVISDLVSTWVHALDGAQWAEVGQLLTEDFEYRYKDRDHEEFVWFRGRSTAVERLQGIATGVRSVQHYLSNQLVTVDGDIASEKVYDLALIAPTDIAEGDPLRLVGGVWTFGLVRTSSGWLINSLLSEQAVQSPWTEDLAAFPPRGDRAAEEVA